MQPWPLDFLGCARQDGQELCANSQGQSLQFRDPSPRLQRPRGLRPPEQRGQSCASSDPRARRKRGQGDPRGDQRPSYYDHPGRVGSPAKTLAGRRNVELRERATEKGLVSFFGKSIRAKIENLMGSLHSKIEFRASDFRVSWKWVKLVAQFEDLRSPFLSAELLR
jgi:hypothetical protein